MADARGALAKYLDELGPYSLCAFQHQTIRL